MVPFCFFLRFVLFLFVFVFVFIFDSFLLFVSSGPLSA